MTIKKTVAIIQARHTSTRLPGKCIFPLAGKPVIGHIVDRMKAVPGIDAVCVAIPEGEQQAPLARVIENLAEVSISRGPDDDILRRFTIAAELMGADIIVRVCADCPAIDPIAVSRMLTIHNEGRSECTILGIDSGYPWGYECHAINREALDLADQEANDFDCREDIHPYFRLHPDRFPIVRAYRADGLQNNVEILLDTQDDYQRLQIIFNQLYSRSPVFGIREVDELYRTSPRLFKLKDESNL